MLSLQQYERLLKAILSDRLLTGAIDTLESQRVARAEAIRGKTLGQLAKELFESYVVPDGFEAAEATTEAAPVDRISMSIRFGISMESDRWRQTKAAVEDLVQTRNELVHHFIERFDLWTEEGCAGAVRYLNDCHERIGGHYAELRQWAGTHDEAKRALAALVQLPEFHDLIVNGIAPYGHFEWPNTGMVRALREALTAVGADGWARLDRARKWLALNHPEQSPEKYRCRTWPQVLNDSGLFQLEYRLGEDGRKLAWFKERVAPTRNR